MIATANYDGYFVEVNPAFRRLPSLARVAAALGLPPREVDLIRDAVPLHDIGKLGVSDTILLRLGALTSSEREEMKRHTATGAAILSGSSSRLRSPSYHACQMACATRRCSWNGSASTPT
jgi:response regulator RpfG family c-di-GMP phosphodiesterase